MDKKGDQQGRKRPGDHIDGRIEREMAEVRALRDEVGRARERNRRQDQELIQRQHNFIRDNIHGPGGLLEVGNQMEERIDQLQSELDAANGRIRGLNQENQYLRQRVETLEANQRDGQNKRKK